MLAERKHESNNEYNKDNVQKKEYNKLNKELDNMLEDRLRKRMSRLRRELGMLNPMELS